MTPDQARRAILAAQGFATSRFRDRSLTGTDATPTARTLLSTIRRLGLLQIDSVNVLTRAHYLPLFSRLGAYDRQRLDDLAGRAPRRLFEYWGHEASLIPVESEPLLRHRMAQGWVWSGPRRVAEDQPELLARVLAAVGRHGPATAVELEAALGHDGPRTQDYHWGWNWSDVKRALEYLFGTGQITAAGRDRGFSRRYDLPSRVIPADVLTRPTPAPAEATTALIDIAARALGVATATDLSDYLRLSAKESRDAVESLVAAGRLEPVSVPGWPPAWRHATATVPRRVPGNAILAPFDPLIWRRERLERVFGMRYRVEIYVPRDRRQYGYYVLPFLRAGEMVARVDLKWDRAAGLLRVPGSWSEPEHDPGEIAADLYQELVLLAGWLGARDIEVADNGSVARPLRSLAG